MRASMPAVHGVTEYAPALQRARVESEETAGRVEAGLDLVVMVARMRRGLQALAPLLYPLHRPSEAHGQDAERDVLRIEHGLDTEAAAHVGGDDPDAVLRQAEDLAEQMADEVGHLRRRPEGELLLGCAPLGETGAAFERRRAVPVRPEAPLDHAGGLAERTIDVASLEAADEIHVAGSFLVHPRRVVTRSAQHVHCRLQRLVLHRYEAGGVLDAVAIGADDRGQCF